jgi:hypothetical protein
MYKSSLEDLIVMNIHHPDSVDGHQLQSELLQHLSPTIQFHFHFQFPSQYETIFYQHTFDWAQVTIYPKTNDNSTVMIVSST